MGFVRALVKDCYTSNTGRPSIDPVTFFKLHLIMFFEGIRLERQLIETVNLNLAHRWYLGYDYPNKQMTIGEGGMIVTSRDEWADLFLSLRNQGRDVFDAWLNHTRLGYNYRLEEMSAALGLAQIQRVDELLAKRAQVAEWYNQRIDEISGIEKPYIAPTTTRMSWFVYVVSCADAINRNDLMAFLQEKDIPSRPYFTPIHLQPFYQEKFGWARGDFSNTEKAGDTFLALPFSGVMTEDQVEYVRQQLRDGVNKLAQ